MRDPFDPITMELPEGTANNVFGYARVSTADQSTGPQIDALKAAGCTKIFSDVASGMKTARPGLDKMLQYLRPGDTLVVWKVDRLGRSLTHLIQLVEDLGKRGIAFKSLTDAGIDTSTPQGKMIFGIMAVLANFERELIRERTIVSLKKARSEGRIGGRRRAITPEKKEKAKLLIADGMSVREASKALKVGKTALYAALKAESESDKA
ncbi:recombinase family protein [Tatumella sp. UCD-D_suzukii]|uniref:recombinase family protein n=1 Tax=Tatumella sp. UCD-D_suzukii TaxID=1408192 RepID=UPI000471BEBE|nr:recombinase family protein [Tatumella sp. UCD-D_suzukii]